VEQKDKLTFSRMLYALEELERRFWRRAVRQTIMKIGMMHASIAFVCFSRNVHELKSRSSMKLSFPFPLIPAFKSRELAVLFSFCVFLKQRFFFVERRLAGSL